MAAMVGGEAELNYTVHIAENPRFVFVSNPICACSTLKATLNLSVARAIGKTDFHIENAEMIHKRAANLLLTPYQLGYSRFEAMLDDPDVPLFAFVRSPQSRFLSAWRKKLSRETQFTRKVRAHLGIDPDVPLADFLTLDAFAIGVAADSDLRDLDEHWRLQRKQIFFDELPRLTLGFVESFDADSARILGGIFGHDDYFLCDAVRLNPNNASGNRKSGSDLSKIASADIARAYAADSEMIASARSQINESEMR
ncbi:sulfotransferase family protein [Paracoccus versutus]|uniref:sulfotransferase family 2 domain-containing protein n=1 Tax=Paracoccus versutus TaxID=34007 RepID=UPI001FB7E6E1|nr:sulfotransferase family 2 domain-containing protein [Paracoccus versutus]MCJ1903392.1 sulfotransferase family protein [Paracoccus versutus]